MNPPDVDLSRLRTWLLLTLSPGFGPVRLKVLAEAGAGPSLLDEAWQTVPADERRHALAALPALMRWQDRDGNCMLPLYHSDYPPLLATINDPPPVLYVRGSCTALQVPLLAIVGTRKPSGDGRRLAREFAGRLVQCGYGIASGLALGIDAEGHASALQAGGRTIAVLGSGLDNIYPAANAALAERIRNGEGALVSEFLPWEQPAQWNFPQRNRIISGLSHGVLVVEAAQRSGSLITARLAGEQGREIFAIPGSLYNPQSRGCHALLRSGAKLVETVDDILEELPALTAWAAEQLEPEPEVQPEVPDALRDVLDVLGFGVSALESLVQATGRAPEDLIGALAELELLGLADSSAAGWRRCGSRPHEKRGLPDSDQPHFG